MKRCPECNRVETDDALKFCRVDGVPLAASAALDSESATISLPFSQPIEVSTTGRLVDTPSIAVLPFVNMSADPDNEFFCDGLAEELLNALAKIDDLKVAARTSSFSFKGKHVNVDEIGLALHVKTILEGSVRKSGNRLRITVQLVNAADGYHLWSERYDREMQDIFDVQDEITLAVVDALKLKLMGGEKAAIFKRHTENAEAYQLYLRGRFFFFKRTPEAMNKAIEYFEEAIELDAEYALAFAGLADCRTFLGFYEINAPAEMVERIRQDAYKALELDDTLSETHTSVAIFRSIYEWDFTGSQKAFETAIKLNPKSSLAHHFSGAPLLALGLKDAAIAAIRRAIELDPFMAIYNAAFGWWLYLSRRFDEAVEQSLKTIEIAPNHFFAHWVLGMTYGQHGRYEEAVTALQKAATLTGGNAHIKAELGRIYAQNGHRDEALRLLDELTELAKERYVSPVNLAKICVGLGEPDRMFEYLEKALAERAVRLPWFFIDPALDGYRDDPRALQIINRAGLRQ